MANENTAEKLIDQINQIILKYEKGNPNIKISGENLQNIAIILADFLEQNKEGIMSAANNSIDELAIAIIYFCDEAAKYAAINEENQFFLNMIKILGLIARDKNALLKKIVSVDNNYQNIIEPIWRQ